MNAAGVSIFSSQRLIHDYSEVMEYFRILYLGQARRVFKFLRVVARHTLKGLFLKNIQFRNVKMFEGTSEVEVNPVQL